MLLVERPTYSLELCHRNNGEISFIHRCWNLYWIYRSCVTQLRTAIWTYFGLPALIGWLAIILRAGTHGVSYELLVMGNNNGNIFLIGGFVLSMLMVFAKI